MSESKTVKDCITELQEVLNKFSLEIIKKIEVDDNVEKILNLKKEELYSLSDEDCGVNCYLLSRHALYVQTKSNRYAAIKEWAEHNFKVYIGKRASNVGNKYTKYEEKQGIITAEDEYASKLYEVIRDCSVKMKELDFLSSKIMAVSNTLQELQRTKRAQRYDKD